MVTDPKTRTGQAAGFTLLELLVVLAIAGLLVSLTPPVISAAVPGARLRVATLDFAKMLRKSRNLAVSRGTDIDVVIDTEAPRYTVGGTSSVLPSGIELDIRDSGFIVAGQLPAFADRLPGDAFTLRFYRDGSASGAAIQLSQGRSAYRIDVDWLIGRVTVSKGRDDAY